jgi:pimeloyl-ACP methyl ester carboxylesterase
VNGFELPLHVETHGPDPAADIEVVVLIHGYGGSAYSWRYWVPHLARRAHVVLVDLKGFGSAPKPDDGQYSPEDQAELVYRMIVQRDLKRVTLMGHSLGGGVALLTALRLLDEKKDRLARMVLVAAAAYPQRLPPFVTLARYRRTCLAAFRLLGPTRVIRWVLRSIVFDADSITESQVQAYAEPLYEADARRALIDVALRIVPESIDDIIPRFREIKVPVLLLWGAHDRVVPVSVGERLKADLTDSRLHIFGSCGHLPPEELPQDTWELTEAFMWGLDDESSREDQTVA